MLEGQRYVLVDCTPHTKANGQPTFLLHWESHCPDCGATFLVKTGLKAFEDVEDISIVAAPGSTFGYENGYRSDAAT